jgi:hypothetical protein
MESERMYAFFRHNDGSWYRLWLTHTTPRTKQGHPWHLHASYDKTGTVSPVAGTPWFEQPYGMHNWDFYQHEDAVAAFISRAHERLAHGYVLMEGAIPSPQAKTRLRPEEHIQ